LKVGQPNAEIAKVTQKSQKISSKGILAVFSAKSLRPLRSAVRFFCNLSSYLKPINQTAKTRFCCHLHKGLENRRGVRFALGCLKMQRMSAISATPSTSSPDNQPTALARALEQNETAQDVVEQSAAELVVIHAVLTQEIPDHVQTGEVAQALQKTDELETKINDTAQELAQVNEVLAQEIDERAELERQLAATQVALAREIAKN
jgi:hypothetical protein